MLVRLFTIIFSILLFSAHLLRFYGYVYPVILLAFLLTLLIKKSWVIKMWRMILLIIGIVWIKITAALILLRFEQHKPWLRLLVIMSALILFNFSSIYSTMNKKVRSYYGDI
jgi:hypothetical protein